MKWLALIGLVALVLGWLRSGQRRAAPEPASAPPAAAPSARRTELVRCELCGLCLPEAEAVSGDVAGTFYCSSAHRDDARRLPGR